MNLYALLSFYDESPTWLANTIASLTRVGVTHLVAVDGRYPLFSRDLPAHSPIDQLDAVTNTAAGAGLALTVYRPGIDETRSEADKRELCFRLVAASATPFVDWMLVIDADETLVEGRDIRDELMAASDDVLAIRMRDYTDPHAQPEPDNGVSTATESIHVKMPVDPVTRQLQARLIRVLDDMRVGPSHYEYTGVNRHGTRVYLRGDIGGQRNYPDMSQATIGRIEGVELEHRRKSRILIRREAKLEYYQTRDLTGIERMTVDA